MQKQAEIEERILGLILGIGIGTIVGFFLRAWERRGDAGESHSPNDIQERGSPKTATYAFGHLSPRG
jgi:hypothetical protein